MQLPLSRQSQWSRAAAIKSRRKFTAAAHTVQANRLTHMARNMRRQHMDKEEPMAVDIQEASANTFRAYLKKTKQMQAHYSEEQDGRRWIEHAAKLQPVGLKNSIQAASMERAAKEHIDGRIRLTQKYFKIR